MKQRIITAVIGIILFVPIILIGGWLFTIAAYALAIVGLYELLRMNKAVQGKAIYAIALLFLGLLIYPIATFSIGTLVITKYDVVIMYLVVLLLVTVITKNKVSFDQVGFVFLSTVYLGIAFLCLSVTRELGLNYLLFVLFTIWATDTGAYFMGSFFGKRKLWPEISPNKTIGGAIGGFLIALLVGVVFHLIYPFEMSIWAVIGISSVISIFGQLGDLVASAAKRYYNIKDYGTVFPGHGGVMDRFDSLIFVLVVLHVIKFI